MSLAQFQTRSKYLMLALDHRSSFLRLINPSDPGAVSAAQATAVKRNIISSVIDQVSGVLLDLDYGLPAYGGFNKPFLLPLEKSGYTDQAGERLTELAYSARELKENGASGVKLLVYFNPMLASAAPQIKTVQTAVDQAHTEALPIFVEIVTYSLNQPEDRRELVLHSLEIMLKSQVQPDVWKLEYPGDKSACSQVSSMLGQTPWILLTRGETFATFIEQLRIATAAGCQGFLAGRALWQDGLGLVGDQRHDFFQRVLPDRFKQLVGVANG